MSNNYTLQYRTFSTLLAEAKSDLPTFHMEDQIQPHQLIKIARKCNYELGLRIYQTKQVVLDLDKGRVRLPNDFYVLNYAFMCGKYTYKAPFSQGTHIEEKMLSEVIPNYQTWPEDVNLCTPPAQPEEPTSPCPQPSCETGTVYTNCKNDEFTLVQVIKNEIRTYTTFFPLRLRSGSESVDCNCPNAFVSTADEIWIKDGWLYSSLNTGKIYLNYQGMLVNRDNEVLVPDHPMLNEFYEYAMKDRIIENLIAADIPVAPRLEQRISVQLRIARNNAMSLVNMPNYTELRDMYEKNRKAQYSKYYDMFSGLSWSNWQGMPHSGTGFIRH